MSGDRSTALLTDHYELTMLESALLSGTHERRSVFEVFARRLPGRRRYGVVAGTARVVEAILAFRFEDAELTWLETASVVGPRTLDLLSRLRFRGTVVGYPEGEVYVPGSPLLTVEGTFAEAVLLETVVLSILNHDCAVATAASRITAAAGDRPCLDMGARRTHEDAAVSAARAAVVAGFAGTSDLEAGRRYGLTTIGTAAHAFTLLHDDEESAFAAQVAALGPGTTLLVDTYDVRRGVERAVAAARATGHELGAVRLDSGDLRTQAVEVRAQLDALGARSTRIVVTSDLDEHAVAALAAAPVDTFGVGTRLVTGSGQPTAELVYKLVAREGRTGHLEPVAKASAAKATVGGRKVPGRVMAGGVAVEEVLVPTLERLGLDGPGSDGPGLDGLGPDALARLGDVGARPLHVPLVVGGRAAPGVVGGRALAAAAQRHRESRAELPADALRLSAGDPAIPTRVLPLTD